MEPQEILKKAILYRANHRGSKEMDILLGSFVDKMISKLDDLELGELHHLLEQDDEKISFALMDSSPQQINIIKRLQQFYKGK